MTCYLFIMETSYRTDLLSQKSAKGWVFLLLRRFSLSVPRDVHEYILTAFLNAHSVLIKPCKIRLVLGWPNLKLLTLCTVLDVWLDFCV